MIDLNSQFGRLAQQHLQDEYFVWLTTVDFKTHAAAKTGLVHLGG